MDIEVNILKHHNETLYYLSMKYLVLLLVATCSCSFNGEAEDSLTSSQVNDDSLGKDTTDSFEDVSEKKTVNFKEVSPNDLISGVSQIPGLTSFIVQQNGEQIEQFFSDNMNADRPVNIKSASKSILSALIGIALQEGYLESIDDQVKKYLPAYFEHLDDSGKSAITIRHLLTMSSGLESTSFRNYGAWVTSGDWIAHKLNGQLEHYPGKRMRYSTGDTHLLSAVLTEATGMSTRRFAEIYLFDPVNERIGGWDRDPTGYFFGGNNMSVSPLALLQFGELYLNDGEVDGREIIPSDWVEDTFTSYFNDTSYNYRNHDYGFLWWANKFHSFESWFGWGYGGQYLFVIPELNGVAVFTSDSRSRAANRNDRIYEVMEELVIPLLYHRRKAT